MKKTIAMILALLALSALTVSVFASEEPAAVSEEPAAAAAASEEKTEIAAVLTEEEALAAALADAGEAEENVTVTKNRLSEKETVDGRTIAVYTVRFSTDTTTWKYFIDANTGAVLYKSVEFQSPDAVFKSRDRGDGVEKTAKTEDNAKDSSGKTNGKAQGSSGKVKGKVKDQTAEAGGEADGNAASSEPAKKSGRTGGRTSGSEEPDAASAATETTAA